MNYNKEEEKYIVFHFKDIYRSHKAIVEEMTVVDKKSGKSRIVKVLTNPLDIRQVAKQISERMGKKIGDDRLLDILARHGYEVRDIMVETHAPEKAPDDFTWTYEWSRRFAGEFRLKVNRVRFIIDRCVRWAVDTKPEKKLFPWKKTTLH